MFNLLILIRHKVAVYILRFYNLLDRRYIDMDNRPVMRISITSLSDPDISNRRQLSSETDFARRIAHSEWIRRKHEAVQRKREDGERAMKKRQEEEEKTTRKKEERARLEKQNFLKWMEGKRQQELDRKAMLQNELELQKRLKEIEDKAAVAKTLYHHQWIHKKKEEQKGAVILFYVTHAVREWTNRGRTIRIASSFRSSTQGAGVEAKKDKRRAREKTGAMFESLRKVETRF